MATKAIKGGVSFNQNNSKKNTAAALISFKDILGLVEKEFSKPGVIDERKKRHFVEEVMPNAPHLTVEEEGMLETVGALENNVREKGKRVREH